MVLLMFGYETLHEPKTVSIFVTEAPLTTSSTLNGKHDGLVVGHPTSNREVLGSIPTLNAVCIEV